MTKIVYHVTKSSFLNKSNLYKFHYVFMSRDIVKVEDYILKMPPLEDAGFKADPKGLGHAYFKSMLKYKDKIVQLEAETGKTDTYGALLERCMRTAIHLRKNGVNKNDVISICSFNHMNSSVPFLATMFLGVKFSGLDPRWPLPFTTHLLTQIKPKYIFVQPLAIKLIEDSLQNAKLKANIIVFGESKKYQQFNEYIKSTPEEKHFKPVEINDINDIAMIFFTSGTTGLPKGICLSHYTIQGQTYLFCGMRPKKLKVILSFATFFWISGPVFLGGTIFNGSLMLLSPLFNIDTIWQLVDKYKVDFLFTVTMLAVLMEKIGLPKGVDVSHFQELCIGGSPLNKETVNGLRKMLPNTKLVPCYGITEAGGVSASFNVYDPKLFQYAFDKPTSSGFPVYGYWYKIIDLETGKLLGPNKHGELYLKSKLLMKKYLSLDTSQVVDSDGWLRTGDIVYYDDDFCFYVIDRIGETFKYQIWFIAPSMIENVIQEHPAVQMAAVIGIPDKTVVSLITALVVLKKDAKNVTPEEIIRFVGEKMDERYHLRGGCKIVKSLPLTALGKVNRRQLLGLVKEGKV